MFCGNCGASIQQGQTFCSRCGSAVGTPSPVTTPAAGRVMRHLKTVAILWIIWSGYRVLKGVGLLVMGALGFPFGRFPFGFAHLPIPPHWALVLLPIAGAGSIAWGGVGLLAAWGLFQRFPWARILTIVLAFLTLFHFPLGTALGIYTLWVLLPALSGAEYRRLAPPVG